MNRDDALDLLIAAAAPRGAAASPEPLSETDWAEVAALAGFHRVRALLYRQALDRPFAPAARRADLEAAIRAITFRNLGQMGLLIELARAFEEAGISLLPHKGPLLANAAYGGLSLREFADLDVLVPSEHLARALLLLERLGYARDPDLAWLDATALSRWTGEASCVSAAGDAVDLHWRLTPPHYPVQLDPDLLWRNVRREPLAGGEITALTPEAHLLLLAVHGAKHAWEALGWLADLAWLASSTTDFDWIAAHALARDARCERPFHLACHLLRDVFQTPLPAPVSQAADRDPDAADLARRVTRRWREGPLASPRSPELFGFAVGLSDGPASTARHLAGLILHPTERDWRAWRLPEPLFALYAPARVLRLSLKYISPRT